MAKYMLSKASRWGKDGKKSPQGGMFLRQLEQGNKIQIFRTGLDSWIYVEKPPHLQQKG